MDKANLLSFSLCPAIAGADLSFNVLLAKAALRSLCAATRDASMHTREECAVFDNSPSGTGIST